MKSEAGIRLDGWRGTTHGGICSGEGNPEAQGAGGDKPEWTQRGREDAGGVGGVDGAGETGGGAEGDGDQHISVDLAGAKVGLRLGRQERIVAAFVRRGGQRAVAGRDDGTGLSQVAGAGRLVSLITDRRWWYAPQPRY